MFPICSPSEILSGVVEKKMGLAGELCVSMRTHGARENHQGRLSG